MKHLVFHMLCVLMPVLLSAQKENMHWYFGRNAAVDFSSGVPVSLSNSAMNAFEGCATISDSSGKLLFYTDGMTVWNRKHQVMQNGSGLKGNSSSTQSAMIVKKPGSKTRYYIITVNGRSGNSNFGAFVNELDMTLDGGNGGIFSMNVPLQANTDEKITAIRHSNGRDIWLLIPEFGSSVINAYKVSSSGISGTPIKSWTGLSTSGTVGYLRISPDGTRIAMCLHWPPTVGLVYIAAFNTATGQVSAGYSFKKSNAYGCEFSPSGRFLYVGRESTTDNVLQYDLNAGSAADVEKSETILLSSRSYYIGGLHMGPDMKLYFAQTSSPNLGCIEFPDKPGLQCNLKQNAVNLSGTCMYGIQNFLVSDYFKLGMYALDRIAGCKINTQFRLSKYDGISRVYWQFGDTHSSAENDTASGLQAEHNYTQAGTYLVRAVVHYVNQTTDTLFEQLDYTQIMLGVRPDCLPDSAGVCPSDSVLLFSRTSGLQLRWDNGDTGQSRMVRDTGFTSVNITDAYGCSFRDSTLVYWHRPATDLGPDTALCVYDSVFFGVADGKTYLKYQWSNGDTTARCLAFPGKTYILNTTDQNGCMSSDTLHFMSIPRPDIYLGRDSILCEGEFLDFIFSEPGTTYKWQGVPHQGPLRIDRAGTYIMQIEHSGCVNADSIQVSYLPYPVLLLGADDTVCFSRPVVLNAGTAETYLWNTKAVTPSIAVNKPGTYSVRAGIGKCFSADTIQLFNKTLNLFLPNAFSPDNNLINEVFGINTDFTIKEFSVFNRWGQLLFLSRSPDAAWDGRSNGQACQQDVYLVLITYRDCNGVYRYARQSLQLLR